MTQPPASPSHLRGTSARKKRVAWLLAILLILAGIVLGTKIVPNDDPLLVGEMEFDPDQFGPDNFTKVKEVIEERAVEAPELASAIDADTDAAIDQYAQDSSGGPIFSVALNGIVGDGTSGVYEVEVEGVPDNLLIRVQTGPAINGTELRDATGLMSFGDFSNQIQFQDAGAALNEEMKNQVLADVDTDSLEGQAVNVTGAFTLINPDSWLITPVALEIQ